jgi:hypothetical protein
MTTPEEAWIAAKSGINLAWLADELKLHRQAVHAWKRVPAERMIDVARILRIPAARLRPDLYKNEPWSAL